MAAITITDTQVSPVQVIERLTLPIASGQAPLTAAEVVEINTSGYLAVVSDDAAGRVGLTIRNANNEGDAVSVLFKGIIYLGDALDGLTIGDTVWVSQTVDGGLDTAAGTGSLAMGYVVPIWDDTTAKKALWIDQ